MYADAKSSARQDRLVQGWQRERGLMYRTSLAAERGMLDSQYNLAQLYETGLGVTVNSAEAYRWYLIAAQSGDQEALKKVATLKAQVPSDGRAEIERQARAFRVGS